MTPALLLILRAGPVDAAKGRLAKRRLDALGFDVRKLEEAL